MRATGIVRRIDDLGRVVIPKEIRRTMHIREGDPLEIYTNRDGEVIFKKYSPIGELQNFSSQYAETLYKTCSMPVVICDRDAVTACAGISKKEYTDRKISSELDRIIESRTLYKANGHEDVFVVDGGSAKVSCAMPIITEGDVTGVVASVYTDESQISVSKDVETKLIQSAASFLGRRIEE